MVYVGLGVALNYFNVFSTFSSRLFSVDTLPFSFDALPFSVDGA